MLKKAVLIALLSLPALAAEEKPGVKVIQEADKVVVRKRTVIDFNDVTVEGELTKPEGSYVLNRNRTRFRSLKRSFKAPLRTCSFESPVQRGKVHTCTGDTGPPTCG